jgi:hypothetical protein
MSWSLSPSGLSRSATAMPGRDECLGGVGGHVVAPQPERVVEERHGYAGA